MRSEGYSSCLVCVCVLCVCLSGHAILAVRAIKSIMKDTIVLSVRFAAILKWRFSLKNCLVQKLEHFLLTSAGRLFLLAHIRNINMRNT